MIFYNPISGEVLQYKVKFNPQACFVMTQLGGSIPKNIIDISKILDKILIEYSLKKIDASSYVTGRDFMVKIWKLIISVPLGIAIIDETMTSTTLCNIFYEIGLMHALGKETLIIKTKEAKVPSDFIRTEYIEFNDKFRDNLRKYFELTYKEQSNIYEIIADQMDENPLLAIDYLRRAYLISSDNVLREKAKAIHKSLKIKDRAKNSVEELLIDF